MRKWTRNDLTRMVYKKTTQFLRLRKSGTPLLGKNIYPTCHATYLKFPTPEIYLLR